MIKKISRIYFLLVALFFSLSVNAQLKWINVDSLYQPLPSSIHVYFTNEPIDTAPFRAYYLIADLKDKKIDFTADTTLARRLTPTQFYQKNDHPLVVINCTFFSFATNQNLNVVIKDGKLVGYNIHSILGRGKDTLTYRHPFGSAIGISKKRNADIAWLYSDSAKKIPYAIQSPTQPSKDSLRDLNFDKAVFYNTIVLGHNGTIENSLHKWKMKTAVGGGPVLLQAGKIKITNNEELKFVGKAINDKHPRTAMGYTKDNKLVILMIEGRNTVAHGATLGQEAQLLKDLGCWEALNLDGGGSSCMLVNGKETIKPSDKEGQRAVPAVFIIRKK
ncbi:MAG TPA: phosphodiester glycosidase family protein [Chitinophagaceae bacterium]|nr:phosphodiester glycosidase family protein [Chitinophagaceae bacterium]